MPRATGRWLVQFGYDGKRFRGWARQPGRRTVEGTLLERLVQLGVARTAGELRLQVASRTDAGVHARANALALDTALDGPTLLRVLNAVSPEIFATRATPVAAGFNPRRATERWYRYFEPAEGRHLRTWQAAARALHGRIDVRSFGRGMPDDRPTFRAVDGLTVAKVGPWFRIDVRARSFVWGMVRKVVAAVRAVDAGTLTLADLRATASGKQRRTLPMAEADRLVLWQVRYPIRWKVQVRELRPVQRRHFESESRLALARHRVLREVGAGPSRGYRAPRTSRSAGSG